MPYESDAQRRYFNANREELESQGVDVDEWNKKSKGKKLPEKKTKKAFGGSAVGALAAATAGAMGGYPGKAAPAPAPAPATPQPAYTGPDWAEEQYRDPARYEFIPHQWDSPGGARSGRLVDRQTSRVVQAHDDVNSQKAWMNQMFNKRAPGKATSTASPTSPPAAPITGIGDKPPEPAQSGYNAQMQQGLDSGFFENPAVAKAEMGAAGEAAGGMSKENECNVRGILARRAVRTIVDPFHRTKAAAMACLRALTGCESPHSPTNSVLDGIDTGCESPDSSPGEKQAAQDAGHKTSQPLQFMKVALHCMRKDHLLAGSARLGWLKKRSSWLKAAMAQAPQGSQVGPAADAVSMLRGGTAPNPMAAMQQNPLTQQNPYVGAPGGATSPSQNPIGAYGPLNQAGSVGGGMFGDSISEGPIKLSAQKEISETQELDDLEHWNEEATQYDAMKVRRLRELQHKRSKNKEHVLLDSPGPKQKIKAARWIKLALNLNPFASPEEDEEEKKRRGVFGVGGRRWPPKDTRTAGRLPWLTAGIGAGALGAAYGMGSDKQVNRVLDAARSYDPRVFTDPANHLPKNYTGLTYYHKTLSPGAQMTPFGRPAGDYMTWLRGRPKLMGGRMVPDPKRPGKQMVQRDPIFDVEKHIEKGGLKGTLAGLIGKDTSLGQFLQKGLDVPSYGLYDTKAREGLNGRQHYAMFSRGPVAAYQHQMKAKFPNTPVPTEFGVPEGTKYTDWMGRKLEDFVAKRMGERINPYEVTPAYLPHEKQVKLMEDFHASLTPEEQQFRVKTEDPGPGYATQSSEYLPRAEAVANIRNKLKDIGVTAGGAGLGGLAGHGLYKWLTDDDEESWLGNTLSTGAGMGLGGAAGYFGGTQQGRQTIQKLINSLTKSGAFAKSAVEPTAPTPSTPSTAHQGSDGGFGGVRPPGPGIRSLPASSSMAIGSALRNAEPMRTLGGWVNRDRSPRLPSGIDQVNSSATKGPGIRSLPASSSMAIGSALRNADNSQMQGTKELMNYLHGDHPSRRPRRTSARKALADSAMKQPGSRWVGYNGPRARQASTELLADLQAGRRLPQVRETEPWPYTQSYGYEPGSRVETRKPGTVYLNTGPKEYRSLGMNPTQVLMHEIRHTRQPYDGSAMPWEDSFAQHASHEIPPSTGDLVNAGEIYKRTTGRPLQHTVNFPSGKLHDINWMIDQAKQHGYLDGSKSMTELMATPEGQQWLRSVILHRKDPGLNKRSVDQTGIADNNRWLNDFDRTNTIFGSGIKRWLNQPGGYFGPPKPGAYTSADPFDWKPHAANRQMQGAGVSPAGSRWVADQAGLGWRTGRTHEEGNTESDFLDWFKAPTPRTPTAIGRMLGATQGLSTPATAKRIKKMQKPVPPVIRYSDPSLRDAVAPRPRSPAPVPPVSKTSADAVYANRISDLPYRERVEMYATNPAGEVLGGLYENDGNHGVFGGGVDEGEAPEVAGARELLEESGYTVTDPRMLDIEGQISEWGPPGLGDKPRRAEQKKQYRGSRTRFATGTLSDTPPIAAVDPSGMTDIKLRPLSLARSLINPATAAYPAVARKRLSALELLELAHQRQKQGKDKTAEDAALQSVLANAELTGSRGRARKYGRPEPEGRDHDYVVFSDDADEQAKYLKLLRQLGTAGYKLHDRPGGFLTASGNNTDLSVYPTSKRDDIHKAWELIEGGMSKDEAWAQIEKQAKDTQEDIFDKLSPHLPSEARHASGGMPDVGGLSDVDVSLYHPNPSQALALLPEGTTVRSQREDTGAVEYTVPGYRREINVYVTSDPDVAQRSVDHRRTEIALRDKFPALYQSARALKGTGHGTEQAWAETLGIKDDPYAAMRDTEAMLAAAELKSKVDDDVYVQSAVPAASRDLVRKHGLLSSQALPKDEAWEQVELAKTATQPSKGRSLPSTESTDASTKDPEGLGSVPQTG